MKRAAMMAAVLIGGAMLVPALVLAGGDAKRGNDLFHKNCASCHGNAGKGDGPAAVALKPKPRDLSDKAFMSALKDEELLTVIKKGGPAIGKSPLMPPFGASLKDDQVDDIAAYVRTLAQ